MSDLILPTEDKPKIDYIKISDLDSKPNFVMGAIIDESGKMQIVINTADEGRLWATFHRIQSAIEWVLQQEAMKRQTNSIQAVNPTEELLKRMRGDDS